MGTLNHRERGAALLIAAIVCVIVVGLSSAFLASSYAKSKASMQSQQLDETVMIADSGLEMARRVLYEKHTTPGWNTLLNENANLPITPSTPPAYYFNQPASSNPTNTSNFYWGNYIRYSNGLYYAVFKDNDDGDGNLLSDSDDYVYIYVTAFLPNGVTRQVEAFAYYVPAQFVPTTAILTGGSLRINGNPEILGTQGSIHTNSNLELIGNPTISQTATASGTVTVTGTPTIGGGPPQPNMPAVPIPEINPYDYLSQADYALYLNGEVRNNKTGALVATGSYQGFSFQGGNWKISGSTGANPGTYFIYGDFSLSGTPTMQATFLVTGSVKITGNAKLTPYLQSTLIIAGRDVNFSGNVNSLETTGLIAAHEQIGMKGNPKFIGSLVAEDSEDISQEVSTSSIIESDVIGGNPTITYNGGLTTLLTNASSSVRIKVYRRLK